MSRDRAAAAEMMRRSGQMGVPVIAVDGQVVVGFDQPRLEQLLSSIAHAFRLGAAVASAKGGGLYVGRVRPGSPADLAGLRPADVVTAMNGQETNDPDDFQRRLESLSKLTSRISLAVKRDGSIMTIDIPTRRS